MAVGGGEARDKMTRMGNQTRLWSCRGLFLLNSSTLTYFGEAPGKQKGKNTSQYFPGLKETKSAVLLPGYVGEAIRGPPHRRPGLRWIFGKWGGHTLPAHGLALWGFVRRSSRTAYIFTYEVVQLYRDDHWHISPKFFLNIPTLWTGERQTDNHNHVGDLQIRGARWSEERVTGGGNHPQRHIGHTTYQSKIFGLRMIPPF